MIEITIPRYRSWPMRDAALIIKLHATDPMSEVWESVHRARRVPLPFRPLQFDRIA